MCVYRGKSCITKGNPFPPFPLPRYLLQCLVTVLSLMEKLCAGLVGWVGGVDKLKLFYCQKGYSVNLYVPPPLPTNYQKLNDIIFLAKICRIKLQILPFSAALFQFYYSLCTAPIPTLY